MTLGSVAITGINGFVGQHLARELAGAGHEVIGIGKQEELAPEIAGYVSDYITADLVEAWPSVPELEAVVHLAGLAAVGQSFERPQEYITVNSAMATNLGEWYLGRVDAPRILGVSSGTVYASAPDHPLTETSNLTMASPYSVSKLLLENQFAYYANRGLDCVIARPFNHVGPGQGPGFLLPDLITQVLAAKSSGRPMMVGNLNTVRDYTDVRDIAIAYRLIVEAPEHGYRLYNVCSGRPVLGTELLAHILEALEAQDLEVVVDESRFRPTDAPVVVGDATRLQADLGWAPAIDIQHTIADIVATNGPGKGDS